MTTAAATYDVGHTTSRWIAAELRAEIARAGLSQATIAKRMGVPGAWISRRLTPSAEVDLTFEETEKFCESIGTDADELIARALRARRDSNPKPSDLEPARLRLVHGPRIPLTSTRPRPRLTRVPA